MNEKNLVSYYNKFNEDKRLKTRHGKLEFITTMKYIHEILSNFSNPSILDVGAGTGAYSIPLSNEGYNVTAVELVKHNLRVIEKNSNKVKVLHGNALDLSSLSDNTFDVVLLFGPMYHIISKKDKVKALNEARRVLKKNGVIMIQYILNEYAVIRHGFKEKEILNSLDKLDDSFHIISNEYDLYSYVRMEEIDELNKEAGLTRIKVLSPDTIANYFREYINKLSEEEFDKFIEYHLSICERSDILGLCTHVLDILKED